MKLETIGIDQLKEPMAIDWHFMENDSLFQFNHAIKVSAFQLPSWQTAMIQAIVGGRLLNEIPKCMKEIR